MFDLPSWYGFSNAFFYREVVLIPVAVVFFYYLWMRLVRTVFREEASGEGGPRTISIEEAYLDAIVNEEMASDIDEGQEEQEEYSDGEGEEKKEK